MMLEQTCSLHIVTHQLPPTDRFYAKMQAGDEVESNMSRERRMELTLIGHLSLDEARQEIVKSERRVQDLKRCVACLQAGPKPWWKTLPDPNDASLCGM